MKRVRTRSFRGGKIRELTRDESIMGCVFRSITSTSYSRVKRIDIGGRFGSLQKDSCVIVKLQIIMSLAGDICSWSCMVLPDLMKLPTLVSGRPVSIMEHEII